MRETNRSTAEIVHPTPLDRRRRTTGTRRLLVGTVCAVSLLAAGLVACKPATVTSAYSESEARALAQHALEAFNAGDYDAWSRDWSDTMTASIRAEHFLAFRDQTMATAGRFVSIDSVDLVPGQRSGYVRWNVLATFERAKLRFGFGFAKDGRKIEGVFADVVQ